MSDPVQFREPAFAEPGRPNVYGPLTPSQMLERTAAMLRENFKLFAGIVLVAIVVEVVIGGVLGSTSLWMNRFTLGAGPLMKMVFLMPLALLGGAIIYVMTQIVQGALFVATEARLAGAAMTVGEACRLAAEKLGKLVGISLLIALRVFGYLLLLYIVLSVPLAVVIFAAGLTHGLGASALQAGLGAQMGRVLALVAVLLVFLLAYCVAMLWLVARYAVSIPAALAENLSVTEAIRRSIHLTQKSKGRLYALLVTAGIAYVLLAGVTMPVQWMTVHAAGSGESISPAAVGAIFLGIGVVRILVSAVVIAFLGVGTGLCYFDLRVRKEGFGRAAMPAMPPSEPMAGPFVAEQPGGLPPVDDLPIA